MGFCAATLWLFDFFVCSCSTNVPPRWGFFYKYGDSYYYVHVIVKRKHFSRHSVQKPQSGDILEDKYLYAAPAGAFHCA